MATQLIQVLADTQANRELVSKILTLDQRLLAVNTVTQWSKAISTSLNNDFNLPGHIIRIVAQPVKSVRIPALLQADQEVIQTALKLTQIQCGIIPPAAFLSLFSATPELASFLQLPLRFGHQTIAVIVIGHADRDHFRPDLATEWVGIMADNMAVSLARILKLS